MWTSYDDVSDRWIGGPLPVDEAQISTLIGDAEDTILREFPDIQDRIDSEALPLTRVQKVVARMVMRHLRNPEGQRSKTLGAGPFQQSVTFGGDTPGSLFLDADDRAELAGPLSRKGKAFSLDTTPVGYATTIPDELVWRPIT